MNNISLLYINGFAVLVLALVLRNYRQKFKLICCEEKAFVLFVFATIAILTGEAVIKNLWSRPGAFIHVVLYVLQTLDFCLAVIVPMLWLYYCLFRIYHISRISRATRGFIAAPAAVFVLLVVISVHNGMAFSITQANEYRRGFAFFASYALGYLYIVAAVVLNIVNRKTLHHGERIPYLVIPAIPILWGIIEVLFTPGYGLMWAATSLAILEIQMLMLNNQTNIDHLTSLNNRMALDSYMRRCIQDSHTTHEPLGLMMIDVDDFKYINDAFGHVEGDKALKATADILRACFAGSYFIARYGGDEFAVVLRGCSREEIDAYLQRLEMERKKHNSVTSRPYTISLSIGAAVFRETDISDIHTMFAKVDTLMYQHKNAKKA